MNAFRKTIEIVSTIYVGYLNDPAKLAGVGMGIMIINLVGMSIFMGFNHAMDTLVS